MRWRSLIWIFAALAVVFALAACASTEASKDNRGDHENAKKEAAKEQKAPEKQVAPDKGPETGGDKAVAAVKPPSKDTFKLTVPKMERINDDEIPTGKGKDETLFHDHAGVHLKRTGYPWEREANVYIAGHRLGFENTDSYLAFWDLNKLKKGDKVFITDSEGRKYTYEVFRKFVAKPGNLSVLKPVAGKNIVTLQTCTLPDYKNRLLVRAELKEIKRA